MTSRLPYALIISGVMLCSSLYSEEQAKAPATTLREVMAKTDKALQTEQRLFITVPALFKSLKRAPVIFEHDKHTAAMREEGCGTCHPVKDGKFDFSFPKDRSERSRTALMDSFHDSCIGCHARLAGKHRKTGPTTCGECHANRKAYNKNEYLPVLPQDHDFMPAQSAHDLKNFRVKGKSLVKLEYPETTFDYYTHNKHVKALNSQCALCHYISPALKQKLALAGKEPTSQDWVREEEKGKSRKEKEYAHQLCLGCHLATKAEKKPSGPLDCKDCHTSRTRSIMELKDIPRPDYGNRERMLIQAGKDRMAAVPFDHKAHIAVSRSCSDCHHKTLESCEKCHTQKGSAKGNFTTLAEAYHKSGSNRSCAGCHEKEMQKPDCAGCHHLMKSGLPASSCAKCHTGKLESLDEVVKLPDPATMFMPNMKDEFTISILEKEYEPTTIKHTAIARKLTEISNNSKLATFFHKQETTICAGCHHSAPVEKNKKVPACSTCHTAKNEPSGNNPALLGAYHQACLGCHQKMGYPEEKMPVNCNGCHKEKKNGKQCPAGGITPEKCNDDARK